MFSSASISVVDAALILGIPFETVPGIHSFWVFPMIASVKFYQAHRHTTYCDVFVSC